MSVENKQKHRLERQAFSTLQSYKGPRHLELKEIKTDVSLNCGWGKLIFANTFRDENNLIETLLQEKPKLRNLAFYVRDPHVLVSMAPDRIFLDPSHTYRLWLEQYRPQARPPQAFSLRWMNQAEDLKKLSYIYQACSMISIEESFWNQIKTQPQLFFVVAEDINTGKLLGGAMGVDHVESFGDPEKGSSLWAVAVDPQTSQAGVGEALVRFVAEKFRAKGRAYLDVSVMHQNQQAVKLYEKLGFGRVPVFCLKNKNPINEPLFTVDAPEDGFNVYAKIIMDEARRRGILVEPLDAKRGYFRLSFGGRRILCRESLSEMTSAIAMSRCQDKSLTAQLWKEAGLKVPHQEIYNNLSQAQAFLKKHQAIVVKPLDNEQGKGISVDIREEGELKKALSLACNQGSQVLLESYHPGQDLRVLVIGGEVVAASIRKTPQVTGDGQHSIEDLIKSFNRRRLAATQGESSVPLDEETERCLKRQSLSYETMLPKGQVAGLRKTANLHTGGSLHDVTEDLSESLRKVCLRAAEALEIPVVGLDLIISSPKEEDYVLIEANERAGLANHEPQPTAEKFIDFLFPQTKVKK